MIIGPSSAGKTTAIQNSGLEFPFGKEAFKGVGGTRNCDWFFSTKGIFLDTAGRYVTETEDKAEWIAFLDILKKNRRKKPINGVIAALNIDEIINCSMNQLAEHAKNIRQRIDELIENLGVNFPVYLVFTKSDLIRGFVEYFGDLSETERAQPWGATFTFAERNNPKEAFKAEFKKLAEKIFEIRSHRLNNPLKREQRKKVFLFPFQFDSLENKLSYLIGEVFQHNPYQDNPVFRGFYFTSGTQEGFPLDIAIKEIARQFNLPETLGEKQDEPVETKNYFIKDLLNDIVIGDQYYKLGQTSGFTRKRNSVRLAVISGSIFFLLLFTGLTLIGYNGSSNSLEKIYFAAGTFKDINWAGNLLTNFKEAEKIRSIINKIAEGEAVESFVSFGMDRTGEAYEPLNELYIEKTEYFFNRNIYNEITAVLNNYANGQDYPGEEIYTYLKTYLLLGNERERLDTTEKRFLKSVFFKILDSKFINQNPVASVREKDSLRQFFRNYVGMAAELMYTRNIYPVKNDNLLISIIRDRLQFTPNSESIYARLKQRGINLFPSEITLEQIVGGRFSYVLNTNYKIPAIFTAEGWKNFVQKAIISESKNPGKEDWVLGKDRIQSSINIVDSEKIRKELMALYINDLQQTWEQFFRNIRYSGFSSVPFAGNSLKVLSDPVNSPLVLIFKSFLSQIQGIAEIQSSQDSVKIKTASLTESAEPEFNFTDINNYFKFIANADGSLGPDFTAVISQYTLLSSVAESIKEGQDLTKDYALKVLSNQAIELTTSLNAIKGALYSLPSVQELFTEPVRLTWNAILNDAAQYLNIQWKTKIWEYYNKAFAGYFPFKNSGSDVPLQDFIEFFKPQDGILWSFFNKELNGFIDKERWKVIQWNRQGIAVSGEFLSVLKKFDDISSTFFKNGDLSVPFKLKPQLPESRTVQGRMPVVEQTYISVDGVENYYKMGTQFWSDYVWPGSKGTPGAKMYISIRNYGSSDSKSYDGDWALFKLLNEASITRGESSSQYICSWRFQRDNTYDVVVSYKLNAGSSKNPFSGNLFKSINLPSRIN
jgi:type VI secretion system protein ImpL